MRGRTEGVGIDGDVTGGSGIVCLPLFILNSLRVADVNGVQ